MIEPKQAIRFTGGKYNGMQGVTTWVGDDWASVTIDYQGAPVTVIEQQHLMQDLAAWQAGKSATELALKN